MNQKQERQIRLGKRLVSYVLEYKKVKRVHLRIWPDGQMFVSAPIGVPVAEIEAFLLDYRSKIETVLDDCQKRRQRWEKNAAESRNFFWYLGTKMAILREPATSNKGAQVEAGNLILRLSDPQSEQEEKRILDTFVREACERLFSDVLRRQFPLFGRDGVLWPQIRLRFMKSRWGSCQPSKGIITMNKRLLGAPVECTEYVMMHELCHFLEPNHSPAFYRQMDERMPDWRRRKRRLEQWAVETAADLSVFVSQKR